MTDPAQIAAKLTEAQREAFIRSAPDKMHPDHAGRISTYGDREVAFELFLLGLIKRNETFSLATPLGEAVRQHLTNQSDTRHD